MKPLNPQGTVYRSLAELRLNLALKSIMCYLAFSVLVDVCILIILL